MADAESLLNLTSQGSVRIVEIDSPPVNALTHRVRVALEVGLKAALADDEAKAIVIACAGRTFFAGADITELGQPIQHPDLNELAELIESSGKPVVAAIHGTALGGGLEVAMACHYRIAVPSAKVGLPESALGLLPGAGGTQRLPRLIGVEAALDMIVGGKPIGAKAAHAAGLIDALAEEGRLREDAIAYAARLAEEGAPLRLARDLVPSVNGDAATALIEEYTRRNARAFKGRKAPGNIVKAVEAAATLPFDQGLKREWELFEELVVSPESQAQRYIFFAERAASKVPGLAAAKSIPISSVAVIGAGTMGSGITLAFLNARLPVTLVDLSAEALERAKAHIARTLRSAAEKGRTSADEAEARLALLSTAQSMDAVGQADLIIEAVFEQLDLKKKIFGQIDQIAKPGAILASNTSFLDLNAIAAATSRPESVVGLHFFAPANIMRLLEVVRGDKTSDAVLATAMGLGRTLAKVAVLSGVCDGFIANRLMARRGEAAERIILEGPMPWDVDKAMAEYGFPMGVFQMLDLVGLDVIGWDRENSAGRTVQEVLCEMDRWGQKKGGGYYDYDDRRRASPSPVAEQVIRDFATRHEVPQREYTELELVQQLLDPVVNEGAKLLEEGIAQRASDIDMALVAGYGWPVYKGGPMFWGDSEGLGRIVARLEKRIANGEAITLSPLLVQMAADGRRFVLD